GSPGCHSLVQRMSPVLTLPGAERGGRPLQPLMVCGERMSPVQREGEPWLSLPGAEDEP
ncbi:hypothetical protein NDU88_000683, partial [Pleurodeles waltl]